MRRDPVIDVPYMVMALRAASNAGSTVRPR
jgi:hypothetical protein